MATVLDEFTYTSFSVDAEILNLSPHNWKQELEEFKPCLLFVESAWFGHQKKWHKKISEFSPKINDLILWCKNLDIPTIFWCKEDPIHFDRFLETASHFDFVFTTDIESIPRYKAALRHSRIFYCHLLVNQSFII